MSDQTLPIALREWAAAVKALEAGRQIIVLRKGGIAEETREFRLESPRFYLFPSYTHQQFQLLKPEAAPYLAEAQAEAASRTDTVRITSFAEVVEDLEITDEETLRRLHRFHIWADDYAVERLKWKKTKPLHLLLLRVYRLRMPAEIPMRESYGGCKSWLRIEEPLPEPESVPVLDDQKFNEMTAQVRQALDG